MSSYSINYIKNDGTEYDLPLEEWQMKAIVKCLVVMLYEYEEGSARYVYLAKDTVYKRLADLNMSIDD